MARRFVRKLKKNKLKQKLENSRHKTKMSKKAKKIEIAKKFVRNFSSQKLSNNEILLLSKGVKFIATPSSKYFKRL